MGRLVIACWLTWSMWGLWACENDLKSPCTNNVDNVNNTNHAVCGDGRVSPGELCDGDDLLDAACAQWPAYTGGTLACGADCRSFDTSGCVGDHDGAAALLSGELVAAIDLTLDEAAVDSIWRDPELYVPAGVTVHLAGERHELPSTGLRLKGRWGSFRQLDGKAAFLLKFDKFVEDRRFFGLEKLALNNLVQDPSMIHEQVGYRLFRAMDVPAPRAGYAQVRVNGEPYGLYAVVESADNPGFLRDWFGDDDGNLYEGEYGVDLFADRVSSFDQDNGPDVGFADLRELVRTLDGMTDPETFMADAAAVIDLDAYLRFAATEIFLGHWDGYAWTRNNYFIYRRPGDGRWVWVPWGIDQTFAAYLGVWGGDGRLQLMCLASLACRRALADAYSRVIDTVDELGLAARTDVLRTLIRDAAAADPRREYSLDAVAEGITWTRVFLENRPADVLAHLDCVDPGAVDRDQDGHSGCGPDCDDGDESVFPGAPEVCNGRDDDCDGLIDDHPDCPRCQERPADDGGTLLFCFQPLPFAEAGADCVAAGGHLVSIHDAATQDALSAAAFAIVAQDWWIGANDLDTEGVFAWTDGSPFDFARWADGEPNDWDHREDCAHLAAWAGGRWNDLPCDQSLPYICHVP